MVYYSNYKLRSYISLYTLVIIVISNTTLHAQFKQDSTKKINYLLIPLIFRSPETLWATGVTGSMSFKTTHKNDHLTRTSTVQAVIMFTQRHQNVQALDATIFFPKETYIFSIQASHSYFPDKYWGLGSNTTDKQKENYSYNQVYVNPHLKRKITKRLFAGLLYEYQNVYHMHYIADKNYDTTIVYGKTDYIVSGIGNSLAYDTRNSSYWPTKGILIQGTYTYFNTYIGSKYNDLKTILDLRYFKTFIKNNVLAIQLYNYSNIGQDPIRELAMLGGATNLRGYYQGRFRDNNMVTFIAEYRIPIYKRFSTCIFGGLGNVYNQVSEINKKDVKESYGAGVRIAILPKEKLNIRIDYGFADRKNRGLYFTVGECF